MRAWLDAAIPAGFEDALLPDPWLQTEAQFEWTRGFRRQLGAKGWLAPTWPPEFGGGGMTIAEEVVIEEELARRNIPYIGDLGISLAGPAIIVWGTPAQKQRYLPAIGRGEVVTWQVFTEPEAGSDLAALKTSAVLDGDDYVINGNKIYIGEKFSADYLYLLAVTDPAAPRHHNISAFMVPWGLPGISIDTLDLMSRGGKRVIFLEDVRVPKDCLVGEEQGFNKGWQVAQTTLELEHGGSGRVVREPLVDKFIEYCRQATREGRPLSADPLAQQLLTEVYIQSHVGRLLGMRNYWMQTTGKKFTYEGPQFALWGKTFGPWLAQQVLTALGPIALINDPELAPLHAELENHQRQSLATHPGGTPEIQRVIISRALGLGRAGGR